MDDTVSTKRKHSGLIPFEPGKSGNPAGRPKGTRNKLGEAFLQDVMEDWQTHGAAAIIAMREKNPADYVKVVASTLPKDINVKVGELDELTDEQLVRQLSAVTAQLAAAGIVISAGNGTPLATEQTGEIQTLQ